MLFIGFIGLNLIFYFFTKAQSDREIAWWLQNNTEHLDVEFQTAQNAYNLVSETILKEIINRPRILHCFSQAYEADSSKRQQIRDSLLFYLGPSYEHLKKMGIKQLHFHLPNNESFLRFHRPQKFGDNLSDARFSVRMANATQKKYQGFEEGKIYNGFRYVFPLFYKNRHIGSIETSYSFGAIQNQIRQYDKRQTGFILKKSIVIEKVFDEELDNYQPVLFSDDYLCEKVFSHFNDDSLLTYKLIDAQLKPKVAKRLNRNEDFTVFQKLNNQYYLISFIAINNVEGQPAAYIFSYTKDTVIQNFLNRFHATLFIGFILISILFVLVLIDQLKNFKIGEQMVMLNQAKIKLEGKNQELKILNEDIQQKKEKIEKNESRLQAIINTSFAGVSIIDCKGITLFSNPASSQIHGYAANEVVGMHFKEYINKADIPLVEKAIDELLNGTRSFVDTELRVMHKETGNAVWIHINATKYPKLVKTHNDSILAVFQNISKQKENERQLRELNATKDRFFSIIGHDLKSPIGSSMGLLELLTRKESQIDAAERIKIIELLDKSIKNVYKLLVDLLTWSQAQTQKIEINPVQLLLYAKVEQCFDLMNETALAKNIELLSEVDKNIVVFADVNLLETIFRNLISNAIKFTPKNGKVIIQVHEESTPGYVTISIQDNGVGIDKGRQKDLFQIDKNISTKGTEKEQGTGLGLILCKEFVELHGGKIWIESETDKGTTLFFTLPVHPSKD